MSDAPAYEIDHGEPPPASVVPVPPPTRAPVEDPAMRAALDEASATAAQAGRGKGITDLLALLLAALCGFGLVAVMRVDEWGPGTGLLLLLSVLAVVMVIAAWRWSRAPAEELANRPLPAVIPTNVATAHDGAERARLFARNAADLSTIALLAGSGEARRARLARAVRGAVVGSVIGLVVACAGFFAPSGTVFLAIGLAASLAAGSAWVTAGRPWPVVMPAAAVPALALVTVLLCGGGLTPALVSLGCAGLAAGLAYALRARLATCLDGGAPG